MSDARAVFIDRDGVINDLVNDPVSGRPESPLAVADVRLLPGASHALRALADTGWLLVGVSNQPAAAKGFVSVGDLLAIQERVQELLAADGASLDRFELCLHHPQGTVSALTGPCGCRKPAPGMLLSAAAALGINLRRSWMVGDTVSDVQAGEAAGCRTVLVEHRGSAHKRRDKIAPTAFAPDLAAAAVLIMSREGVTSRS